MYYKIKIKHFHKFVNKLPVFEPTSKLKIIWDMVFFMCIMFQIFYQGIETTFWKPILPN